MPFLHAADAATHAPPWTLALLLVGGAAAGLMLTSGGDMLRRLRGAVAEPVRLLRWGRRDAAWWAEVDVSGEGVPVDGWRVLTRDGRTLTPTVEVLRTGSRRRLGLVVVLEGDDDVTELRFEAPGIEAWSQALPEEIR